MHRGKKSLLILLKILKSRSKEGFHRGQGDYWRNDAWRKMCWIKILWQPVHVDTAHTLVTTAVTTVWVWRGTGHTGLSLAVQGWNKPRSCGRLLQVPCELCVCSSHSSCLTLFLGKVQSSVHWAPHVPDLHLLCLGWASQVKTVCNWGKWWMFCFFPDMMEK